MIESEQNFTDVESVVAGLDKQGVSPRLRACLEQLKAVRADDTANVDKIAVKERLLRKISDVIVASSRALPGNEKLFWFKCFKAATEDGFSIERIGADDRFLARLVAGNEGTPLTEQEKVFNREILRFATTFEEEKGFFEETAVRVIDVDSGYCNALIEECIILIKKQNNPNGVVFATALLNKKQVKSAVKILAALAEKGQATEMTGLMHRLLPQAKGAENLLLNVLRINLNQQKSKANFASVAFRDYIGGRYLQAARSFAENQQFENAAMVLGWLADGGWINENSSFVKEFSGLCNVIMVQKPQLAEKLVNMAQKSGLKVYDDAGKKVIGDAKGEVYCRMAQTIVYLDAAAIDKILDEAAKMAATAPQKAEAKREEIKPAHNEIKAVAQEPAQKENSLKKLGEKISSVKDKININNVLENKIKEADKHFDKIKQATVSAIKVAGEQAVKVSQKVSDLATVQKAEPVTAPEKPAPAIQPVEEPVVVETKPVEQVMPQAMITEPVEQTMPEAMITEPVETFDEPASPVDDAPVNEVSLDDFAHDEEPDLSAFIGTEPESSDLAPQETPETVTEEVIPAPEAENTPEETLESLFMTTEQPSAEQPSEPQPVNNENSAEQEVSSSFYEQPFWENDDANAIPSEAVVSAPVTNEAKDEGVVSSFYEQPFWEDNSVDGLQDNAPQTTTDIAAETSAEPSSLDDFAGQSDSSLSAPQEEVSSFYSVPTGGGAQIPPEFGADKLNESDIVPAEFEKNKANIDSVLGVNPKELDNQLNQIKNGASDTVSRANEASSLIKKKVADTNISASSSVGKIRQLAQKIKFFKK